MQSRSWPSGRWSWLLGDVSHFDPDVGRFNRSNTRIDFFYGMQPEPVSSTRGPLWQLSLGNVTAVAHSKDILDLYDGFNHDPIVASLRLDPPGAVPERLTFRRHPLAFARVAEIDVVRRGVRARDSSPEEGSPLKLLLRLPAPAGGAARPRSAGPVPAAGFGCGVAEGRA